MSVPATKMINPINSTQLKTSWFGPGTNKKNNQISKVLDVSIVDLYAADAFFVTPTPDALKRAIDTIIAKVKIKTFQLSAISLNPLALFSITPPLQSLPLQGIN